jgi:alkylation response protein AidB-like acyl-CoA dehydrogenase
MLLCRTEPELPAHQALSMLLVPLDAPGIEVREIITAFGTREFAQVHFDDVTVPAANVLGDAGSGWHIAMQLLGYERGPTDIGWVARLTRMLTLLEDDLRAGRLVASMDQRRAVAHAWVELRTLQVHVQRTLSTRLDGTTPGPEGSIDKLLLTRAEQLLNHINLEIRGSQSALTDTAAVEAYFWSRGQSIFGGTEQIQRNIVAQRLLGMPRAQR